MREVPDSFEDAQLATRDGVVGCMRVADRDDVVSVAPHDQRGEVCGQVQTVERVDGLPAGLDDATDGAYERLAILGAGQRRVRAPHLAQPGCAETELAQEVEDVGAPIGNQAREHQRHQVLGTREGDQSQQQAHFAAEAAAADEHQPVAQFRVLVRELHRHAAAERVPDDGGTGHVDRGQEVAQPAGERAERIVAHRFRRLAVAEQVGCDHVVVLGEPRVDGAPGLGAACKAVDEHHGLAATAAPVADFVTVNDDARKRE